MLVKGEPWWRLPERTSKFRFEVLEDIDVAPYVEGSASQAVAARRVTARLQQIFLNESDGHASH
jgi:hypothetical protein